MNARESANYARIVCLTMQEGTEQIYRKVLRNIEGNVSIHTALMNREPLFKGLRTKRILSQTQYDILYPTVGQVQIVNIDMTLWVILARNLTRNKRYVRWNENPKDGDLLWQHDVIRLREIRNKLFHLRNPELSSQDYMTSKNELVSALRRLGSTEDVIQDYLTRDLDPDQTAICCAQLNDQCSEAIQQAWMASIHGKKELKRIRYLLGLLFVSVAVTVITITVIYWTRRPPCASAIERIRYNPDSIALNFMRRSGWGALPRRDVDKKPIPLLAKPVNKVVISTADVAGNCDVTTDCCATVKYQQEQEYKSTRVHWQDISFNFLIGNDGVVYEGRGATYTGRAVWHRNFEIISIGFLGNFICTGPSRAAITALFVFLDYIQHADPSTGAVRTHPILAEDYELFGHCQVNLQTPEHNLTFADTPGAAFMREIRLWDRLSSANLTHCRLKVDCMEPPDCCRPCTEMYKNS